MAERKLPAALVAAEVAPRAKPSNAPAPIAARLQGREKRALGDAFGLTNFGANLTRLAPGARSSLRHAHTKQDEFIYILAGQPTLLTDAGRPSASRRACARIPRGQRRCPLPDQ